MPADLTTLERELLEACEALVKEWDWQHGDEPIPSPPRSYNDERLSRVVRLARAAIARAEALARPCPEE